MPCLVLLCATVVGPGEVWGRGLGALLTFVSQWRAWHTCVGQNLGAASHKDWILLSLWHSSPGFHVGCPGVGVTWVPILIWPLPSVTSTP